MDSSSFESFYRGGARAASKVHILWSQTHVAFVVDDVGQHAERLADARAEYAYSRIDSEARAVRPAYDFSFFGIEVFVFARRHRVALMRAAISIDARLIAATNDHDTVLTFVERIESTRIAVQELFKLAKARRRIHFMRR